MEIGLFIVLLSQKSLDEVLDYVQRLGLKMVEVGCGNYPGSAHCEPKKLLTQDEERQRWLEKFEKRGIKISALSCHGNPLSPNKRMAKQHHETQRLTFMLAEKIGVDRVCLFSGCPGGSERDAVPHWVVNPWPGEFLQAWEWQWEKKIVPYWKKEAVFARDCGVKLAFEMHPGMAVYNPASLLRLREECGDNIGANLDPSHLFWQGIDPLVAIRVLKGIIYHIHAKDTYLNLQNIAVNGVLDVKPYNKLSERSWFFRTVGYGHSEDFWRSFVSELRLSGYDYVLSIEHEDALMSIDEGVQKAVEFLRRIIIKERLPKIWWT
ncbi:MAG: sugar phosphate isomerase/epimerase [Candidatus Sumerlaeia bacterium]|nr:sugar phosphate isomerase/epimerase [Candidatus Sumerlaeia bacterium]